MTAMPTARMFQGVSEDVNGTASLFATALRHYPPLTEAERRAAALPINGGNHFGPGNCGEGENCPHCAEDNEILDEAAHRVVMLLEASYGPHHADLKDAILTLVREARRR